MKPLLRRVPRRGQGRARRRPRQGLVLAASKTRQALVQARPRRRERAVHLHRQAATRARRCSCSPTRTTRASTRRRRPTTARPRYADGARGRGQAAGYSVDLWDVDTQGVPHDLGVLSHYKAVVWYVGRQPHTPRTRRTSSSTPGRVVGELPVHRRRRAPAVPDARRARLPQRGRQARSTRARRRRTTASSSARHRAACTTASTATRRPSASITTGLYGRLRRLPDPGERLPPVLARRVRRGSSLARAQPVQRDREPDRRAGAPR